MGLRSGFEQLNFICDQVQQTIQPEAPLPMGEQVFLSQEPTSLTSQLLLSPHSVFVSRLLSLAFIFSHP